MFSLGLGWFRRVRPPPPPLVLVFFRRPPLFLFPCLFRVRPLRARCVGVGVFSWFLLPFLCVPRPGFLLSSSHLIFMLISLSFLVIFIFTSLAGHTLLGRVCVCVERLNRRKTSRRIFIYINILILMQGVTGVPGGRWPMKTPPGARVNVPA